MDPNDITPKTIKNLFYEQIKNLTLRKSNMSAIKNISEHAQKPSVFDIFDFQFSDRWLK